MTGHTTGQAASDCMAFCRSMGAKYRQLLKTGDLGQPETGERPKRSPEFERRNREALQMLADGKTMRAVADHLGIRPDSCDRRMRKAGWKPKSARRDAASIRKRLDSGESPVKIASEYGVKPATITTTAKRKP